MVKAIYLHGRGELNPDNCHVFNRLKEIFKLGSQNIELTYIEYTQDLDIKKYLVSEVLEIISNKIINMSQNKKIILIGYSFGGLFASWFAEKYPKYIHRLILLAPAIDNYERNFANIKLPKDNENFNKYLDDLLSLSSRPNLSKEITNKTMIIHGNKDNDQGGGNISRIISWVKQLGNIKKIYYPENINHSLMPWLYLNENKAIKNGFIPVTYLIYCHLESNYE